jgi:acetyl esterase/lipase
MKISCLLPALLTTVLITPVFASQTDEARLKPAWQSLDKDLDGKVGLVELHPIQTQSMTAHDANNDSIISLTEYAAFNLDPRGARNIPIPNNVNLVEDVPYASTDDPRQQLDIFLPKEPSVTGPLPVIAYIHGGGWLMGSKVMARSQVLPLLESGRYAAVSFGYRLSWQDTWPAQINDVKAGIRWIRAHAEEYNFDPTRICAFGASAGGHLTAMLGTTNGVSSVEGTLGNNTDKLSDVQCAIDFFGPADLRKAKTNSPTGSPSPDTQLLGEPATDNPELAANASPVYHVDAGDVPFFIVHGTQDRLVNYSQSVELDAALRNAEVPVIFQTVEGGGHGDFGAALPEVNNRIKAFLEKTFYDPSIVVPRNTLNAAGQ